MLILSLYICFRFSFLWLDCWGRVERAGETKGDVDGHGAGIMCFHQWPLNPCSSWRRLSFSVVEWHPDSMVINPLVSHRIRWRLNKPLDLLSRKTCRHLLAQRAWGTPWSPSLESEHSAFPPTGSPKGWNPQCSRNWASLRRGRGGQGSRGPLRRQVRTLRLDDACAKGKTSPLSMTPSFCAQTLWPGSLGTSG